MTPPLYQRLLRNAGLKAPNLAEVTARLQRSLSKRGPAENPGPASGLAAALSETSKALSKFKLPGLESVLPKTGTAAPAMAARAFSSPAGSRPYKLFVPSRLKPGAPLLIMLHGCTQSAEDFAAGTRMNALAEAEGFLVVYPEQLASANAQRCWNWFNPNDRQRDHGEAAIIADMTKAVIAEFGIDARRVFVAGLSAGGAHAAILGATYPDLFAAIGVHSGLACGAAHDMMSAFSAMQQGRPGQGALSVPTILFHGDRDTTVNPRNADELAAQLAPGPDQVQDGQVPGGLSYTRKIRAGANGAPALEQWRVHGAGHAWSGGSSEGSFTEPRGPDASREMLRFFLSVR